MSFDANGKIEGSVIRVLAAVVVADGQYLVCRRPPEKRHGGLWEFPGGKVEPGETDFDAAARELREELDVLVIAVGREVFAVRDPGSPYLIAFVEVQISGSPVCREHTDLQWASASELSALALAPSDQRFAEHLRSHARSMEVE